VAGGIEGCHELIAVARRPGRKLFGTREVKPDAL